MRQAKRQREESEKANPSIRLRTTIPSIILCNSNRNVSAKHWQREINSVNLHNSHKYVVNKSMNTFKPYTINLGGRLIDVNRPLVMGILNVTPDSFYSQSRCPGKTEVENHILQIAKDGADIIDIGGYSSRPMADDISPEEEFRRLSIGMKAVRKLLPYIPVSIDTFRASVAERCITEFGPVIVNDISGGQLDEAMIPTVGKLHVPYILMHMRGNPHTMTSLTDYNGQLTASILRFFGEQVRKATHAGIADIILDPGFGFSHTLEQNYELLASLEAIKALELPILVGVSRKSMIYKLLHTTPEYALNGTTVVNTIALLHGASILRVHDVREAAEAVKIVLEFDKNKPSTQE